MPRFSLLQQDCDNNDASESFPEPDHPIGFGPQNNCKWMNSSAICSSGQSWYGLDMSSAVRDNTSQWQQSYPPLSSYICAGTASSRALLAYHQPQSDDNDSKNNMANSFSGYLEGTYEPATMVGTSTLPKSLVLKESIKEVIELERHSLQHQHRVENQGVRTLIKNLEKEAACILKERREMVEKQRLEKEESLRREESTPQQRELDTKSQVATCTTAQNNAAAIGILNVTPKIQAQRTEAKGKEEKAPNGVQSSDRNISKTAEHIMKGKKLIAQLVKLRESIEPFDKNKAVSKRRLGMKKTIRGKLNTLSESAAKVWEVSSQVNAAINTARQEDAQIKEAMKQRQQGVTPDMALGKRYIVDLFASNVIQRVQAEGFNGPRGDGFPLASMIALVAAENKEVIPVLAAHIYTACRIAIPSLPDSASNASEDEFMVSLGMLRDKNGEFESWDRFSSRTENIISIVANIQASMPPTHSVLGGHKGAAEWLERFLESLPAPPTSPLPLLTATVLYAFLCGAGCMLAHNHEVAFKQCVQTISEDILNRLDQGEIGKPSFIRLSKTLEKGFDGFRSTLPQKAIPEMYNSSVNMGTGETREMQGHQISSNTFGTNGGGNPSNSALKTSFSVHNNSFGATSLSSNSMTKDNAFGNNSSVSSNPFSIGSSRNQMQSGNAVHNSFANTTSSEYVSQVAPTSAPEWGHGGIKSSGNQPLGGTFGNKNNPFASVQGLDKQTSFGVSSSSLFTGNVPFSSSNQLQGNTAPFNSSHQSRNTVIHFGSSNLAATKAIQFGSRNQEPTSTSFGTRNQANASAPSFGSNKRANSSASPFGSGSGNNNNKKNAPRCKFHLRGSCKYGSNCRYSHEVEANRSGWNQAGNNNWGAQFGGRFNSNRRNPFA